MRKVVGMVLVWAAMSGMAWAHGDDHHKPGHNSSNKPWSPRKDASGVYGTKTNEAFVSTTVAKLFENPDPFKGKLVEVKGLIQTVCQVKGCWMMMQAGKHKMRIRFKGYKFFLPVNSKGYRATAVGYARKALIPVKLLQHYALDRGDVEGAKKITKPEVTIAFTASWVVLSKLNKPMAPKAPKKP